MGFKVKIPTILSIFASLLLASSTATGSTCLKFLSSLECFNQNLFSELLQASGQKNIIYSPFSIQTCLAMARMGADAETAVEMDNGLGFTGQTVENVADNYYAMLAKYENSKVLKIANRIYVSKDYQLQDNYTELLAKQFFSSAENIDFSETAKAANTINSWVESKTDGAIRNLITRKALEKDASFVLLSGIHFKGEWANAFMKNNTMEQDFYTDETNTVKVPLMFKNGLFTYGPLPKLKSSVVVLPYKDSDLSMVIFVPFSRTGLSKVEEQLKTFQFQSLRNHSQIVDQEGSLYLPKFKAEYEIKLNDVLMKMGMKQMFGNANFGKILKSSEPLSISHVVHKATIEVSEEGTVAAAATGAVLKSRISVLVRVNSPFAYAIINEDYVPLFQGTFVGP